MAASPSYAMGQLQRAFDSLAAAQDATSLARAETKIARWRSVIADMAEGSLSAGSRTPVSGTPAWVTLEVAHGGLRPAACSPRRRWMRRNSSCWPDFPRMYRA
jgi:hypothetical protein